MSFGVALDEVAVVGAEPEEDRVDVLPQANQPVAVLRGRDGKVELQVAPIENAGGQHALDALVGDLAEVLVTAGRPAGRRQVAKDQRVIGGLVVERRLETDPVVQEAGVAKLVFSRFLRLEAGVADRVRRWSPHHIAAGAFHGDGGEERDRVPESGALARLAIRGAETQGAEPVVLREERLFADYPGQAGRRIVDEAEVLAERRVVVATQGAGEEDLVAPGKLLLHVAADRDDVAVLRRDRESTGGAAIEPVPPARPSPNACVPRTRSPTYCAPTAVCDESSGVSWYDAVALRLLVYVYSEYGLDVALPIARRSGSGIRPGGVIDWSVRPA
jgi:hypothetical protein